MTFAQSRTIRKAVTARRRAEDALVAATDVNVTAITAEYVSAVHALVRAIEAAAAA